MSDVVERLRAMADDVCGDGEASLCREAAAEIERGCRAAVAARWVIEGLIGQLGAYDRLPYAREIGEPASKRLDMRTDIDELVTAHGVLNGASGEAIESARQRMQEDLAPHRALGLRGEVERLRAQLDRMQERLDASQAEHAALCDALAALIRGEAVDPVGMCCLAADSLRTIAARLSGPQAMPCPACGYADDHCDTAGGGLACGRCGACVRAAGER